MSLSHDDPRFDDVDYMPDHGIGDGGPMCCTECHKPLTIEECGYFNWRMDICDSCVAVILANDDRGDEL